MSEDREQLVELLKQAAAAVDEAGLPADLRSAAFSHAVAVIAGSSEQGSHRSDQTIRTNAKTAPSDDLLGNIASKLGVDRSLIEETFEVENDELQLTVAKSKLDSEKGPATKQIARLVAAGRQAAGLEEATDNSVIRSEVEAYGKLDAPNFARDIKRLDETFTFPDRGRDWKLKVRRSAFADVGALVKEIHGVGQS